jgi:hypothetical protein
MIDSQRTSSANIRPPARRNDLYPLPESSMGPFEHGCCEDCAGYYYRLEGGEFG